MDGVRDLGGGDAIAYDIIVRLITRAAHVNRDTVQLDKPLAELGVDSLRLLSMLLDFETELKIELDDSAVERFLSSFTVGDSCDAVAAIVKATPENSRG